MNGKSLVVWRDRYGSFERVGSLHLVERGWMFSYDPGYDGQPISTKLPVAPGDYSEPETAAFFSGLSPEGRARAEFLRELRAESTEYEPLLRRLNDESQGALVFTADGELPGQRASYVPLDHAFFDRFASSPQEVAVETMGRTRLSLAGAMAKVGLYRSPEGNWFLPMGSAPSNYIVKAGNSLFPHEVLNEALCLETARRCGYDVPLVEVIGTEAGPLLAIERYDRRIPQSPMHIDGMPAPMRLHQEDFCQLCGLPQSWKYEPTDGTYLGLGASNLARTCANAFGEVQLFVSYVLFDYLIGNCDNHLKNYSVIYSADWSTIELAPRYDIVSTTVYPNLYTEMGVSLQPSRSIYGLTRQAIEATLGAAKLPVALGMDELDEIAGSMPRALQDACEHLVGNGFQEARSVADIILDGVEKRSEFSYTAETAKMLV